MPEPPDTTITCVDCGGAAHLLTTWPDDDPPYPGDLLTYRCADCWDRWDTIMPGGGGDPGFDWPGRVETHHRRAPDSGC